MRRSGIQYRTKRMAIAATALAALLTGCAGLGPQQATSDTYQLSALQDVQSRSVRRGLQILVPEPAALKALDSENIVVRPDAITLQYLAESQWSDRLPRLVQSRLAGALESTGRFEGVGLPGQGLAIDFQIVTDIREFGVVASAGQARVAIGVKLLDDRNGTVRSTQSFSASAAVSPSASPDQFVAALDRAFASVVADIVLWTTERL